MNTLLIIRRAYELLVIAFIFAMFSFQSLADGVPFEIMNQLGEIQDGVGTLQQTVDKLSQPSPALCDVEPTWGKKIPAEDRFVTALDGTAFCDRETGLVWERTPSSEGFSWTEAMSECATRRLGGRMGWHLPFLEQLLSLADTDNDVSGLPANHPFEGVPTNIPYWTATTEADIRLNLSLFQNRDAWYVQFSPGILVSNVDKTAANRYLVWCVRGGQLHNGQNSMFFIAP